MTPVDRDFHDLVFPQLPSPRADLFDVLYDEKPDERRYNVRMNFSTDADMFAAVQDLIANRDLPFNASVSTFMRHAVAATVESLKLFLSKDTRTLWSAFQSSQRRLSAERYALTAEEQVKQSAELLEQWTMVQEWDSVLNDLEYTVQMIEELPHPAWQRRMARTWMQSPAILRLLLSWQETMAQDAPGTWRKVRKIFDSLGKIAEVAG